MLYLRFYLSASRLLRFSFSSVECQFAIRTQLNPTWSIRFSDSFSPQRFLFCARVHDFFRNFEIAFENVNEDGVWINN